MPVYLIQVGDVDVVKIGKANSVAARMATLQAANPQPLKLLRLFRGGLHEEKCLRQRFTHCHLRGEWYRFSTEMIGDVGLQEISFEQAQAGYEIEYHPPHIAGADYRLWRQALRFAKMSKSGETPDEIFRKIKQAN